MPLQLDDLAALDAPTLTNAGVPLLLPVVCIGEDPEQPRREFDDNALNDLAATIRERGVRQPISVRPDLHQAGRWILNFGARRLRASRLAGLTEIPAFIDSTADDYDQVIENEQREGLKPLELALFVQKRLALGDNQAEISRRLGKSRQWVTLTTALIEAPDWLLKAYREGRCRGMLELYDLRRLHADHPQAVEAWVADREAISRDHITSLRAELTGRPPASVAISRAASTPALDKALASIETASPGAPAHPAAAAAQPQALPHSTTSPRLHVELHGQPYQLVVTQVPPTAGHVYIQPLDGRPRFLAPAEALTLKGFIAD